MSWFARKPAGRRRDERPPQRDMRMGRRLSFEGLESRRLCDASGEIFASLLPDAEEEPRGSSDEEFASDGALPEPIIDVADGAAQIGVPSPVDLSFIDWRRFGADGQSETLLLSVQNGGTLFAAREGVGAIGSSTSAMALAGTLADFRAFFSDASSVFYLSAPEAVADATDEVIVTRLGVERIATVRLRLTTPVAPASTLSTHVTQLSAAAMYAQQTLTPPLAAATTMASELTQLLPNAADFVAPAGIPAASHRSGASPQPADRPVNTLPTGGAAVATISSRPHRTLDGAMLAELALSLGITEFDGLAQTTEH